VSSGNQGNQRGSRRLADRYDVQQPIGEGASAITYRGWDGRLERVVAIKILRQDFRNDDGYVRRFRQEARSAASVSHGNVVDVYDFGQEDGDLFIVMQYVDGEDLKRLIQREAPLPPNRAREIIGQVLDGLQAIHAAGIVHRDIKPQNVLIGRDGNARVTDFGVAHLDEDSGLTTAGTTVGTAAYMAPEQAQAGRVTQATDLYATGIVLYEMLTGYLPFNGPTSMATMLEHIQSNPVPPSQRLPGRGITPAMDSVVLQALAKQPDRRFNSARAMKQAVNNVFGRAGSETTVATPAAAAATQVTRVRAAGTHQARSAPVPPPGEPSRGVPVDTRDAGAGVNSAVKALLIVILLGVFAAGAWLLFDNLQDDNRGTTVPPTETVEVTEPDPTATDAPAGIIEPVGPTSAPPTETPEPTETPQPTPEPTETPVPTPQPTLQPAPTSTPETGVIEPLDITPIPTQPN
jgi:eukaryotic-like serine/threonine-protein kinase